MGTAYGWPNDMYIEKKDDETSWTLHFHQTEPDYEEEDYFTAEESTGFVWVANEKGMNVEEFLFALMSSE